MIKLMGSEFTCTLMELGMKANGKMIYNMGKARKRGLMDLFMKDSISKVKSMALVYIVGMMVHATKAIGMKIR